jgi:enoyl-[acyl-carrier protein] reductase II
VVSSTLFALKAQNAGVDAIVAEGFEAGGHNGRDETTTFTLIPMVKEQIKIPVIAGVVQTDVYGIRSRWCSGG